MEPIDLRPDDELKALIGAHEKTIASQQDRLEELEITLEKAERLLSLGLHAGGIIHDLNNVLTPMTAYPGLILHDMQKDDPHYPMIDTLGKSAKTAAEFIDDLLTIVRGAKTEHTSLALNPVVRRCLHEPAVELRLKKRADVVVNPELDPGLPSITGASRAIFRATLNLLLNAIEATQEGAITISTRLKEVVRTENNVDTIAPGTYVVLAVKDPGAGMSPEVLNKVFKPLFSDQKVEEKSSGTGLGLCVVRSVASDHKAPIEIHSVPGKGSEFLIHFPVNPKA